MSTCTHPPLCPPSCDHCLAYDRLTRNLCARLPASAGSKWCSIHEELQAKLLKSYKRLTKAVEAWDDSTLVKSMGMIEETSDMAQLRTWSELARSKWGLVNRVIVSREDHHAQFYAGGDWNHCLFVETLNDESARLERTMRALDRRAYTLTLVKSDAEWVLAPSTSFICNDEGPPTPPLTPPQSPLLLPTTPPTTKSQRKKAHRKANKIEEAQSTKEEEVECCPASEKVSRHLTTENRLERMRAYLVPPDDLPRSVRKEIWHAFISGIFRYVILRLPALAPLAMAPHPLPSSSNEAEPEWTTLSSIEEFLSLLESRQESRCGEEIDQLWSAIKFSRIATNVNSGEEKVMENAKHGFLGVGVLSDLLLDVYRVGEEREARGVEILGGRVWKVPSTALLSDEGFDIFYQFIACSGCSLSITRSFTSCVRNRRLAILGSYPAWLTSNESSAEHTFRLARMMLCGSNNLGAGKKIKRVEQKGCAGVNGGKRGGKKVVIVEEWERAWIYLRAPLDDPWTLSTLSSLASDDRFSLLARNGSTSEILHSPNPSANCKTTNCHCCSSTDLWLSRVRSGLSPAQRRTANWTTSTFFPTESIFDSLNKSSSERRFGYDFSKEVMEVLVMDNRPYGAGEADWNSLAESVAKVIISTSSQPTWSDLLTHERRNAIEKGEMTLPMRIPGKVEWRRDGEGKFNSLFEEDFTARRMFREAS